MNTLIQDTNEISKYAAIALWCPLESNDMKIRDEHNRMNIQLYNNLIETLNSILKRDTL
jgi:hypothetical protein